MDHISPFGFFYSMGTGEELKCVKGVERFTIPTEKSDSTTVCYAALIQTDNFIVPYKISVDSYVLAELNPNTGEAGDVYYELDSEQIQVLQQEQKLPNPTPTHEIGMDTYLPAIGLIALVVAWLVWQIKAAKTAVQNSQPPSQTTTNSDDMAELERLNLEADQGLNNEQSENDNTHNDNSQWQSIETQGFTKTTQQLQGIQ